MPEKIEVTEEEIDKLYLKLLKDAKSGGYNLNPDVEFTKELADGLLYNQRRYGYFACPCRLSEGEIDKDRDIICPCDYRDPDLAEWGACYCALYVDDDINTGVKKARPVPERRPMEEERERIKKEKADARNAALTGEGTIMRIPIPVWRCTVCGYLCAREEPPLICPVCKAKKDRFERFL